MDERRNSVSYPERQKTDSHKNASLNSFRLSRINFNAFLKTSQGFFKDFAKNL